MAAVEKSCEKQNRRFVLIALTMGTFMAALDASIVNVSLPTMMRSLKGDLSDVEWVVNAYMIGFALVMPLTQWLKQRWGYFRLYFSSLFLFTAGSLLCGLSASLPLLIIARIIQAIGGGALTPTAMAALASIYPANERGRVMGLWGLGVVMGPAIGPTIGGILTEKLGWPSIFLINLPIGIYSLYLSFKHLRKLPNSREKNIPRFDVWGFVWLSIFTVTLLYGIGEIFNFHTSLIQKSVYALVIATSLVGFIIVEKKHLNPLIELNLFKNKIFRACIFLTFTRMASLMGGVFLLPFLLQDLMHYSETKTGLIMLPGALIVAALMPLSGKWSDKWGVRIVSFWGLSFIFFSMLFFAALGRQSSEALIYLVMIIRGVGIGLLVTPIAVATVNSVNSEKVALASSVSSLIQQIGGALGVSVLALIHQLYKNFQLNNGMDPLLTEELALRYCFGAAAFLVFLAYFPLFQIPKTPTNINSSNDSISLLQE